MLFRSFMVSLTRAQMPTGLLQFDTVQFVRDVDSAGTLEKVVADTVLQFRDSSGKMRSQTSIPFPRGVSSRWSALIAESPRSERGKPGSVRTTFAIDNADASLEQTIIVTVYDDQGRQVGKGKFIPKSPTYYLNPGVYSATLADILGFDLPASQGSRDFHGTVVFEGEQKVPFQPTVFQVSDGAFYSTPATAE